MRSQKRQLLPSVLLSSLLVLCAALFGAALLTGCTSDFDSQMLLSGYRVVGIESSPPEVDPDDTVTLRVHEYYTGDDTVERQWRLCLDSWGSAENYRCQVKWLELNADLGLEPVATEAGQPFEVTLALGTAGLNLRERLADLGDVAGPDGAQRSLEQGFDIWLELRSGPSCRGCDPLRSAKRLRLRDAGAGDPNQNPVIDEFTVTGSKTPGSTLVLKVNTDTPETYRDTESGERLQEEYLYSWYTSGGKTEPTRSFGSTTQSELQLPDKAETLEVVVTVRDGRGGLAVSRQSLRID